MTQTEQIKLVAEYMHPQAKWVGDNDDACFIMPHPETFEGGYSIKTVESFNKYTTSLDSLAPVYKKVMGELEAHEDGVTISNRCYFAAAKMEPLPLFNALHDAIVFINQNKEK